ncbi:MAG: hypothetical protein ACKVQW_13595 [Pyrinomonadaceae bacterium]
MKYSDRFYRVIVAATPFVLVLCLLAFLSGGKVSTTAGAQTQPSSTKKDGLQVVTFDTPQERVTIKLPDDIRTGDMISGTLVVEPKGATSDERAKNLSAVKSRVVRLLLTRARKPDEAPRTAQAVTVPLSGGDTSTVQTLRGQGNSMRLEFLVTAPADFALAPEIAKMVDAELGRAEIPINTNPTPAPTPDPKLTPKFDIPPLGQTGRPVVITGPFDGKSSNTDVKLTTPTVFKKTSTYEEGIDLPIIAESPRKSIIEFPQEITGPHRITVTDGRTQTSGPYRNVGVNLTAPKTNLIKGEKTTLTIQVSGLEGIRTPVPLTLTSRGVITMQGGAYQELTIQPSEVRADGTYSTTREITGVEAGAWGATATVVTDSFNIMLIDPDPPQTILINSFTGEYVFCGSGLRLAGTGHIKRQGCIITLTDNRPDREVRGTIDSCVLIGNSGPSVFSTATAADLIVSVTDTRPVRRNLYFNPLGRPFPPVQDVSSFATCP